MTQDARQIAAVTFNYKTPDLIQQAVKWFKRLYPRNPLMIIDDGSRDGSTETALDLAGDYPATEAVILDQNIGQGRCFHFATQVMGYRGYRYVFFFDSDIVFRAGGFLEVLLEWMVQDRLYAIGWHHPCDRGNPIVCTAFALLDLDQYNQLPPYTHGPNPSVPNMEAALRRGMGIQIVDIDGWAYHITSGTSGSLPRQYFSAPGGDSTREPWDQCGPGQVDVNALIDQYKKIEEQGVTVSSHLRFLTVKQDG